MTVLCRRPPKKTAPSWIPTKLGLRHNFPFHLIIEKLDIENRYQSQKFNGISFTIESFRVIVHSV